MIWLQENWIIAAVVAVLALIIIAFLLRRPKAEDDDFGDDNAAAPAAKKPAPPPTPLAPNKPDIIAAEPARFKPIEPATPPPGPAPIASIAPAATPEPAAEPAPTPAPLAQADGDNLRLMKGLGPKLVSLLATLGVTRFEQIAAWTDADIARIDAQLGSFQGRILRDNWVDQAGYLARRDKAGFEAKYGALGGEI